MANLNRFQRRFEKRRRVYGSSLKSDELAFYDPVDEKIEVIKLHARDKRFVTPHLSKNPTFGRLYRIELGSSEEHNYLDKRMRDGLPRYHDVKTDTILG
jgi:hypothetical protein